MVEEDVDDKKMKVHCKCFFMTFSNLCFLVLLLSRLSVLFVQQDVIDGMNQSINLLPEQYGIRSTGVRSSGSTLYDDEAAMKHPLFVDYAPLFEK